MTVLNQKDFGDWLACLQPEEGRSAITVLKVSVDESGSHGSSPILVVAACIATPKGWKKIRNEWGPRANAYPEGYHATKAKNQDNLFLASLLPEYLEASLAVVIPYEVFRAVVPHSHRSRFGAEYTTAIRACTHVLAHWCDRHWYDWTTWVLEAGHKGEDAARQYLDSIVGIAGGHVHSHAWVGKRDLITHAPDVVSHAILSSVEGDGPVRTPLLTEVLRSTAVRSFDRETLAEAVEKGTTTIRKQKRSAELARARRRIAAKEPPNASDALPGSSWEPRTSALE